MHGKLSTSFTGKIAALLVILLAVVLTSSGCVEGLRPLGWSGGMISEDTLFIGSQEGRVVAINTVDESRQWSEPMISEKQGGLSCIPQFGGSCTSSAASGVAIYGTPAVSGDLVYVGGYNGKMYAFTVSSLEIRWVYPRIDNLQPIIGGAVVDQGKVYFGNADGKVYALDAATGDKQWEFETKDKIWATPAIAGNTLFIGSFDHKLYALDITDGSLKWEFETEGGIASTPLIHEDTVYIGSFDRNLYALNTVNGNLKWKFMGENWFWAKPVVSNNTIYTGCLDSKVYVLNSNNGDKITEFDLGSPVSSSPIMVNNSIIVASQKGVIYALDTGSHELKQISDIEEKVYGPISAHDGIIYIHTQDLTLHRVNAATGVMFTTISLKSK